MNQNKKKGFTLVELVIVIAVIAILAGVMIATFSNVVSDAQASADMQEVKSSLDATYYEFIADEGIPNALVEVAGKVAGFAVLPEKVLADLNTNLEDVATSTTKYYSLTGNAVENVEVEANEGNQYYKVVMTAAATTGEGEEATTTPASIKVTLAKVTKTEPETEDGTVTYPTVDVETYVLDGEITGKNGNTFIVELVTADNYADKDLTEANIGYYTFEAKTEN